MWCQGWKVGFVLVAFAQNREDRAKLEHVLEVLLTQNKTPPNAPKRTPGRPGWGTWFLQAQAGKVVWVHGFAAEIRVFDTDLAEEPSGGGVGGEVNLPDAF